MIEIGFDPLAKPTARDAFGLPIRSASWPYEIVSPYGIRDNSRHTRSWKRRAFGIEVHGKFSQFSGEIRVQLVDDRAKRRRIRDPVRHGAWRFRTFAEQQRPQAACSPASSSRPTGLSISV